jgi:antitoxin YefM
MTRHVPYDEFRKDPAKYMNEVGGDPLYIDRKAAGSVVMVSKDEFEGLIETLYLLSSPANARDLQEGIAEAEASKFVEHELIR